MDETTPPIESERRLVTVMFADISGFTAMSEKMDPEEVVDVMKGCFTMMGQCIEEHGGTIDKFIGDCVMVLFGAPKAQENAPHRALNTALEIRKRLQQFNEDKKLLIPLSTHIGINTGPVIAGMMGSDKRQDFTVMGDTVNLASRMEGAAEKGSILVTENTYKLTERYFDFQEVGPISVKGKMKPVKAYKVLGPRRVITRIEAGQGKGLSPFVGRAVELQLLDSCLSQTVEGRGQVIGIVGEPGVGKSRLVSQFREALSPDEYSVIEGGCVHFGDIIPYLPILDMLKDYFDIKEDEGEAVIKQKIRERVIGFSSQFAHILSPLFEVLSLKVEDDAYLKLDGKQRRDNVFEAIRLLLVAESQRKPLVMIIEDLHWIDNTSEEFLTFLINSLAATRIMLILLYRPEYPPAWVGKTYYSQIRVDQLPRKTIEDLVKGILGCEDVEHELIGFIADRSEGNPLFIEEMTYNLLENGSIKKDDRRYALSLKPSDIQIPITIYGIIAARLDRLEGTLKSIMQTASVIGREFAFRILQAVAALRENLKPSLLTLQELEFIYEKNLFPELEYIFKHVLTRDVAYNSLLMKKRKETHEKVAQAIEQLYADRIPEFYEMLAYHYSLSEKSQKAYEYLKLSADKAAGNFANWEAIRFYKEALQLLDSKPDTEENKKEKYNLCTATLIPMMFVSYPEGTIEIMHKAEALAKELDDEKRLAMVYSRVSNYYTVKGNIPLALEYSEKTFSAAEKVKDVDLMAYIARDLCVVDYFTGNLVSLVERTRKVLPLLEEAQKEREIYANGMNVYSCLCNYHACSLGLLGKFDDGRVILEKGLVNALAVNDRYIVGHKEFVHAFFSFWEGNAEETINHAQKALQIFNETGSEFILGLAWAMLGSGYFLSGEYGKVREYVEKGLNIQVKAGWPLFNSVCYAISSIICSGMDDLTSAKEHAELCIKYAKDTNSRHAEGIGWVIQGFTIGCLDNSQFDTARNNILKGISLNENLGIKSFYAMGYAYLGQLFALAGRKEEAIKILKKAESLYLEMTVTPKSYWLARTREFLARLG